jgi:DNA-binding NarL/FixJ family response regulator
VLGEVVGGRGQTVLIAGDAGIGKSRLIAEASGRAQQLGFLVLEGQCFEPDRVLPFAPFLDLLRSHVGRQPPDDLARQLGPAAPELIRILPELATLLPGIVPATALEPAQDKHRLFHVLGRYLTRLAAVQPVLVALEDLHWSDEASLELLLHLIRKTAPWPILLLLAFRPEEAHPSLTHFLAELDRGRLATEVAVNALSIGEVGEMVRAIFALNRPVGAAFLHALYALTEGNPFFVEEVVGSLIATGDVFHAATGWERKPIGRLRIPRSVDDAVRRRVARVSDDARQVLRFAAVAGRRFDFALLQTLTGRSEDDLLPLIKDLIEAQLLVEASAEQFAFRHALTREAIATELLARERQALHRRVAKALERGEPDSVDARLEDLAYHCFEAGEWTKALAYAQAAGERAQALAAPRAAVEQFTRALSAAAALEQPLSSALLRSRARAHDQIGDFDAARVDFEAALRLAEATGDRRGAWQALLDLGAHWTARDYDRALEYLQQALDLARAMDEPATLAHSLNHMGNWYANHEQPDQARHYHQEALAIFERLGDRHGVAATLDLLGMTNAIGGDLVGAMAALRSAATLFRALEDRQGLVGCLTSVGSNAIYELDTFVGTEGIAETIRTSEQALTLAREIDWRTGEAYVLAMLGECVAAAGDFGRGLDLLREALAIAEEIEHRQWMAQAHLGLGGVHADLLAPATARAHFAHMLALGRALRSPLWTTIAAGRLASVLITERELDAAQEALAEFDASSPMQTPGQRLLWCARAELALARDDPAAALEILSRLYRTTVNLSSESDIPRLAQLKAQALAALGQAAEAEQLLRAARTVAADQGARLALWRLHTAIAALLHQQGRAEEAGREAAATRQLIQALASTVSDEALRGQFLHAATARLPAPTRASERRAAKAAFGGLTSREREVAALIAQGRTNRSIAEVLCVSERTIDAHVGNVLHKLDFAARSQIAAWAVDRGLAHLKT